MIAHLAEAGHEPIDCGALTLVPDDDYPEAVRRRRDPHDRRPGTLGIVIGGSGNGEQIAANKVRGCGRPWSGAMTRRSWPASTTTRNVMGIGARNHPIEDILRFTDIFVSTPFSAEPRHARRIAELTTYEATGRVQLNLRAASAGGRSPRRPRLRPGRRRSAG